MNQAINGGKPAAQARRLLRTMISNPVDVAEMAPGNLDLVLRLARRAGLLGRLAARLKNANKLEFMPKLATDQLESALVNADARARLALWEMNRIAWATADDKSIQILALKGCAYLQLNLPNAEGRNFADVDLMVAESDLSAVEAHLQSHGWRSTKLSPYDQHFYRAWSHEVPPMVHAEREVEVDLHHNILPRTARLKPQSSLLLKAAQSIPGSRFKALCNADIVLHAMTHLMFNGDMADSLRDLVDIHDLIGYSSDQDPDFWDKLLTRADQLDLDRPTFYALRYADQLLGTPIPASVQQMIAGRGPPAVIIWLMDHLVPSALFPQHPDFPSRMADFKRLLLYMRSHWISMPPLQLARHLAYKFYIRHIEPHRWFKLDKKLNPSP